MAQIALRPRERQREGSGCRTWIAVLLGEGQRGFLVRRHPRCERHPNDATTGHSHALSQADDRVERRPCRPGERPSVHRLGKVRSPPAAQETCAIGLPFHRTLGPSFQAHHVHGPHFFILGASGTPAAEKRPAFRPIFRFDEQLPECGMGNVGGRRGEHNLRIAGDLDLARAIAVVGDRQPTDLDVVLGGDRNLQLGGNAVVATTEGRLLGCEAHQVFVRLFSNGMVGGRPDRSAPNVAQVNELASRIARRIRAASRHRAAPAKTRAASGIGHDRNVVAV